MKIECYHCKKEVIDTENEITKNDIEEAINNGDRLFTRMCDCLFKTIIELPNAII